MKTKLKKCLPILSIIYLLSTFCITANAEENEKTVPETPTFYVCEAGYEYQGEILDVIPYDENNDVIIWKYLERVFNISVDPSIVDTFTIGSVYNFRNTDFICCKISGSYYYFIPLREQGKTLEEVNSSGGMSYRVRKGGHTDFRLAAAVNDYYQAIDSERVENVMTFIPRDATIEYTIQGYSSNGNRAVSEIYFYQFVESGERSHMLDSKSMYWRDIYKLKFKPEVFGVIPKLIEMECVG